MKKIHDFYFQQARAEKYPARSVYKLMEIDRKHRLIKKELRVLDIGCAPGSWSLYILSRIKNGSVIGVDLKDQTRIHDPRFTFIKADIHDVHPDTLAAITKSRSPVYFDLITSDAAPNTTGNKFMDAQSSLRLVERVFQVADALLKEGGSVVAKILQGEDTPAFVDGLKNIYARVILFKPKSSRSESRELFILALQRGSNR
jgi:23S rRNA (uridine2552-2'-O)-methyltransferase